MRHLLLVAMLARFDNLLFELGWVVTTFILNGGMKKMKNILIHLVNDQHFNV